MPCDLIVLSRALRGFCAGRRLADPAHDVADEEIDAVNNVITDYVDVHASDVSLLKKERLFFSRRDCPMSAMLRMTAQPCGREVECRSVRVVVNGLSSV